MNYLQQCGVLLCLNFYSGGVASGSTGSVKRRRRVRRRNSGSSVGSAAAASAGECHPFLLRGGGQLSHHRHHRSQGHLVSRTGNSDDILNSDDTAAVDKQIQELMSVIVSQGKAICDQLQKLNDSKSAGSSSNLDTSVDRAGSAGGGSQSESRSESRQSSETRSTRKQQKVKSSRDPQRAPKRDAGHPDHLLVASDLPPTTSPSNSSQLPSAPITTSSSSPPVVNGIGASVRASASAIGSASAEEAKYQRDMLILQTIHSELVKLSAMNDKLVFAEDSVDRLQIALKQQTESELTTNPPLSTDQLRVSEEQVGTMQILTSFVGFFHTELRLFYVFYHNGPSSHILTP